MSVLGLRASGRVGRCQGERLKRGDISVGAAAAAAGATLQSRSSSHSRACFKLAQRPILPRLLKTERRACYLFSFTILYLLGISK